MRVILYCAADAPLIMGIHTLFSHIQTCPRCELHAHTDAEVHVSEMFGALNAITTDEILTHDYQAAVDFCELWMERHEMLSNLDDMLVATPVGHA